MAEHGSLALVLALTVVSLVGLRFFVRAQPAVLAFRRGVRREVPLWTGGDLAAGVLIELVTGVALAIVLRPLDAKVNPAFVRLFTLAASWGVACVFVLAVVRIAGGQPLRVLGFQPSSAQNLLAVGWTFVLAFLPLHAVTFVWHLVMETVTGAGLEEQEAVRVFRDAIAARDHVSLAVHAVGALIIAPLAEELFFRGFIYGYLRARWGVTAGLVVSSTVFALLHFSLYPFASLFCVGLILALIYERTESLLDAIAFHALFNGVSLARLLFRLGMEP